MSQELLDQLKISLTNDRTSLSRKKWAKLIAKQKVDLIQWVDVLEEDKRLATCFLWLLCDICTEKPTLIFPIITHCFEHRYTSKLPGYKRSLAKWLWQAGVPKEIEGLVLDEMIKWIMSNQIKVGAKCYALEVVANFAKEYPEIITEIRLVIDTQMNYNTVAFKMRAKKILKILNQIDPI